MYEVEFYRDKNGKSEIVDYLDDLKVRGSTSKKSVSTVIKSLHISLR